MTVVTSFPLNEVIQNRDATGRIAKWALELMGQGISYAPQMTIKSQVLADFIAEWTEIQMLPAVIDQEYWTMYFNGSLMKKGASVGLVFVLPLGVHMRYMVHTISPPPIMWPSMRHSLWGVQHWISLVDHMGYAPRGGSAHKTKPCGA